MSKKHRSFPPPPHPRGFGKNLSYPPFKRAMHLWLTDKFDDVQILQERAQIKICNLERILIRLSIIFKEVFCCLVSHSLPTYNRMMNAIRYFNKILYFFCKKPTTQQKLK